MFKSKASSLSIMPKASQLYETLYFMSLAQKNIKIMSDKAHDHYPAFFAVRIKWQWV